MDHKIPINMDEMVKNNGVYQMLNQVDDQLSFLPGLTISNAMKMAMSGSAISMAANAP